MIDWIHAAPCGMFLFSLSLFYKSIFIRAIIVDGEARYHTP
ncbi:putative membrane protein [Escherichia coli EPEC C342-62]|nr:putative membrane protein [Escherichia coli EPEC C342-62]